MYILRKYLKVEMSPMYLGFGLKESSSYLYTQKVNELINEPKTKLWTDNKKAKRILCKKDDKAMNRKWKRTKSRWTKNRNKPKVDEMKIKKEPNGYETKKEPNAMNRIWKRTKRLWAENNYKPRVDEMKIMICKAVNKI